MRYPFFLSIISVLFFTQCCFSQTKDCDIKNIVHADGTMYYYLAMDTFYFTKSRQLMGGMVTDKENYFLTLKPEPAPVKIQKLKDYKSLSVQLANDTTYQLDFFDARFIKDSVYVVMYMFDFKKHQAFLTNAVESVTITTPQGTERFKFRLHKQAIMHHLNCLSAGKNNL